MNADYPDSRPMNPGDGVTPEPDFRPSAGHSAPSQAIAPSVPLASGEGVAAQEYPAPPSRMIPEDLRVPWGWVDLAILVPIVLSAAFLASMALAGMFAGFHVSAAQIRNSPAEKDLFAVLNQILLSFALLGYLAAQMRMQYGMPFWRTIGWRPLEAGAIPRFFAYLGFIAGGIVLSFTIQLASSAFAANSKLPIETFFQDRRTAILLMMTSILIAPIVEETIFRGYIYPVVARSFGVTTSVIATGVLFGALHAWQLWGGWWQIALLIIVGVIFTYVRAVSRTVVASYLLHVSYNFLLSFMFLVASHGLRTLPANS